MTQPLAADDSPNPYASPSPAARPPRATVLSLSILFGSYYFVQGMAEPGAGLLNQPLKSLLKGWGQSTEQIGAFMALFLLPWSCKFLYGPLTDFLPILGRRRKSYLLITSTVTVTAYLVLYSLPLEPGANVLLLYFLVPAGTALAFSDVVIDATMVEKGQPLGLTGRLQSVQWTSIFAASILAGWIGGLLSQSRQEQLGFLICGLSAVLTLGVTIFLLREPRAPRRADALASAGRELRIAVSSPVVWAVGLFLFLWHFNPFTDTVLYNYATRNLNVSEESYGWAMNSAYSAAAMVASLAYGFYCRRLSRRVMIHVAIVMGIVMTVAFWMVSGSYSLLAASLIYGAAYATATMTSLDLAAQACPRGVAGTTFACLMGMSNLGTFFATKLGSQWYDAWTATWNVHYAYQLLVGLGAATTAMCWLLAPLMRLAFARAEAAQAERAEL